MKMKLKTKIHIKHEMFRRSLSPRVNLLLNMLGKKIVY